MRDTRIARGLEVYHRDQLYDPTRLGATEIYADWAVPHRFLDIVGMSFDPVPDAPFACLHLMHDRDHGAHDPEPSGAFGSRGVTLLGLLLPAFKAGVRAHLTLLTYQRTLASVLDAVPDGIAVYSNGGECRNRALLALLAADPERDRIERSLCDMARRFWPTAQSYESGSMMASVGFSTTLSRYRLQANYTTALGTSGACLLLLLQRLTNALPSPQILRERWHLTAREAELVPRLCAGHTARTIATALGISPHTARRHTEAVLRKLGVSSRALIAAKLTSM
jgi:DNA-binding CsgD family transcriptional regulator